MYDTVKFRMQTRQSVISGLRDWDYTTSKGITKKYKKFPVNDGCNLKIESSHIFGTEYLTAEVSLPKLMYENNVQMITPSDLPVAFDLISNLVGNYTGADFDAFDAELIQADVCYNWQLTQSEVVARTNAAKLVTYPNKFRRDVNQDVGSVYFRNAGKQKQEEILLYSKHAETAKLVRDGRATIEHLKKSVGVFRLEHRFYGEKLKRVFKNDFGFPDIKAKNLFNSSFAKQVIENDMKILGLDKTQIGLDGRVERLRQFCTDADGKISKSQFKRLFGTMLLCDEFGADNLIELDLISRSVFYKEKSELEAAGVWQSKANRQNLPPLSAPNFEVEYTDLDYISLWQNVGNGGNDAVMSNTYQTIPYSGLQTIEPVNNLVN